MGYFRAHRHQTLHSVSHFTIHPSRLKPLWRVLFCITIAVLRADANPNPNPNPNGSGNGTTPTLRASFSQVGVWGTVTFERGASDTSVRVRANLTVSRAQAGDYSWAIYAFPVDYSRQDNCNAKQIGRKAIINLDEKLGKLGLVKEVVAATTDDPETTTLLQSPADEPEGNKVCCCSLGVFWST